MKVYIILAQSENGEEKFDDVYENVCGDKEIALLKCNEMILAMSLGWKRQIKIMTRKTLRYGYIDAVDIGYNYEDGRPTFWRFTVLEQEIS